MIEGRYVKDNHITEVYLGDGMTEIVYEPIKAFNINRERIVEVVEEPKRNKRDWVLWTAVAATFLCGTALGGILQSYFYCVPLFIVTLAYLGMVIYANRK